LESGVEIELTLNKGTAAPYTRGYGHVAFAVDGIDAFCGRLESQGPQPGELKTLRCRHAIAARFFVITDPDGDKIEVLSREEHHV
jgi:lactoylglutathione lyase